MDIEFDPDKDAGNVAKHGVSLALAETVLQRVLFDDVEWVEGEERTIALGMHGLNFYVCVYTMRGATHRIISLRKATKQEVNTWE